MANQNSINNRSWSLTTDTFITATTGNITASAGNMLAVGDGSTTGLITTRNTASNVVSAKFHLEKNRSGGAVQSGDGIGQIAWYPYDGSSYLLTSVISCVASGTIGTNRVGTNLRFWTHPDSTTITQERMVINSAGTVTINTPDSGNGLVISGGGSSTTGRADFANGISFDAGTNILSTYDVGTWTPAIAFGGASVGVTYSTQAAEYVKIGRLVYIFCRLTLTSKGTSTGSATITGLPYQGATGTGGGMAFVITLLNTTFNTIPVAQVANVSTQILLRENVSGGTQTDLTDADFTNTSTVTVSGVYRSVP